MVGQIWPPGYVEATNAAGVLPIAQPVQGPNSYTLLIGNPGVGKSTLLNGLVGRAVFKSGVSFGKGLTQVLQLHESRPGRLYGDTPGLADTAMRQKAADEIGTALRQNGRCQLVFVGKEDSGRVRPQDAATIKLVLDALPKERSVTGPSRSASS